MDAEPDPQRGRLGLHGRVESQLVQGEPVEVVATDGSGGWSQVFAPWQPSPTSERGYPGWVPTAHLAATLPHGIGDAAGPALAHRPAPARRPAPDSDTDSDTDGGADGGTDTEHPALVLGREHLGLPYLWGGLSPLGLDCSGLVHHTWRRFGIVVPRDAYAQAEACDPVELGHERSGDLYFFAHPGARIHHVGIVVEPGRMLHASETGHVLVEEQLPPARTETLVAVGRLPHP